MCRNVINGVQDRQLMQHMSAALQARWMMIALHANYWCKLHSLSLQGTLTQGLESYWLADTKFVAGTAVSIADLLICTELSMLRMLDGAQEVSCFLNSRQQACMQHLQN